MEPKTSQKPSRI